MLSGLELSLPALFLFGLQSSPHCAVMCGGLQLSSAGSRWHWSQLQGLRLLSYSLLGAIAGVLGGHLLRLLPLADPSLLWRSALGLAVLALGLLLLVTRQAGTCPRTSHHRATAIGWALMPCPMLYAALAVAAFAAHPLNAAMLMLAFALGTLPMHSLQLLAYRGLSTSAQRNRPLSRRHRGGLIALSGCAMLLSAILLPADSLLFCRP